MSTKIGTATDYIDLLADLDAFLCDQGHAWGLAYTGAGTGRLQNYLGTATSVVETITATATSATSFTVVGSVSGSLGTATVGTPFSSSKVTFTINSGGVPFTSGDAFTFNTSPKWTRLRFGGCAEALYRTANFTNAGRLFDNTFGTTGTMTTTTTFPATVTVQMQAATKVRAFSLWSGSASNQAPSNFGLQWSDDGIGWTTAESWSGQTWAAAYTRRDFILAADPGAHLYWRVNITAAATATLTMTEVRLWGDTGMLLDVSSRFEFAWQAPGVDGAQQIYVAGYTDTDNTTDQYNLVFRGFRYWTNPVSSVIDVLNNAGDKSHLLSKTSTGYWFVAHGGRVAIVTRTSSFYELSYIGFGLPYETPAVHPFPYLVGAPYPGTGVRWDLASNGGYRNPSDPGAASSTVGGNAGLAAILPDGNFLQVSNRYPTTGSEGAGDQSANGRGKTWPYAQGENGLIQANHLRDSVDGTKPLLPLVIFRATAPAHVWGEFDGLYWTTGFANSAEATIRDGAIDHLVVPNINRAGLDSFCALALD